jgi:hypothetical protein
VGAKLPIHCWATAASGIFPGLRTSVHGLPFFITEGVDLALASVLGTADTMGQAPPPPAVRWALIRVASMKSLAGKSSCLARA